LQNQDFSLEARLIQGSNFDQRLQPGGEIDKSGVCEFAAPLLDRGWISLGWLQALTPVLAATRCHSFPAI